MPSVNKSNIGSVPYLNAKPLIYGIENDIQLAVPSLLSQQLHEGKLTTALVPIAEFFDHPSYTIIPNICISSAGPVRSVYLAYKGPLAQLKCVRLDPHSRTSNLLLKLILKSFFNLQVNYISSGDSTDAEAQLLIGDPALKERTRLIQEGFHLLDLGESWHDETGLPFVYALWCSQLRGGDLLEVQTLLTACRNSGMNQIDQIAAQQHLLPPKQAKNYLTQSIRYQMGELEWKGIQEFHKRCQQQELISEKSEIRMN